MIDSLLLSGSEAYMGSLMFYDTVKSAAKNNVPNAQTIFEDLNKRFQKTKRKKSSDEKVE